MQQAVHVGKNDWMLREVHLGKNDCKVPWPIISVIRLCGAAWPITSAVVTASGVVMGTAAHCHMHVNLANFSSLIQLTQWQITGSVMKYARMACNRHIDRQDDTRNNFVWVRWQRPSSTGHSAHAARLQSAISGMTWVRAQTLMYARLPLSPVAGHVIRNQNRFRFKLVGVRLISKKKCFAFCDYWLWHWARARSPHWYHLLHWKSQVPSFLRCVRLSK